MAVDEYTRGRWAAHDGAALPFDASDQFAEGWWYERGLSEKAEPAPQPRLPFDHYPANNGTVQEC